MTSRVQLRIDKAEALLERNGVQALDFDTYAVKGNASDYTVSWHQSRPAGCTCPAGAIWQRISVERYGKHACYHIEAVAMMRREAA